MKIIWNSNDNQFEVILATGDQWISDKTSAQNSGMKCTGPPDWTWRCRKIDPLLKLKEMKLPGLTITPEAFQKFNELRVQADANQVVKKALADARKAQKLEQRYADPKESEMIHGEEFDYNRVEPVEIGVKERFDFPLPKLKCHVCQGPVYFYERQEPPTCLDCEVFHAF